MLPPLHTTAHFLFESGGTPATRPAEEKPMKTLRTAANLAVLTADLYRELAASAWTLVPRRKATPSPELRAEAATAQA